MVAGSLVRVDPPRPLGEMTLLARLGEGGMATVFLARTGASPLGRLCAVKVLRPDLPDHDYRTRFLDEARVVVRLHHNNLVNVHAAAEIEGQLYIAMEAIAGRDLASVWDQCANAGRAVPVALAVNLAREVLRGLHYAHTFPGLSLVHRDISPSNVLIDWAGAVRLADFGLATSTLKASSTVPGVVFGKVGYMSPEQARHEPLDGRADVYAVGVLLWELLTGKPMRAGAQLDTQVVSQGEVTAPGSLSARVDSTLDAIVLKALQRDRSHRYPDAEAMMMELGSWLNRQAPGTGQEALATFMRELFPGVQELEALERAALLAIPERSGTQILAHVKTDAIARHRAGALGPIPNEVDELSAGAVIADRYRVLSKLGRGGMGTVYMGEHVTVGRSVAIKVLTREWSNHEGVMQRFRAEARAASAAGHPNIVEVFDAGELPDRRLYLVMEFLTGRTLYEEVQVVGPLDVARACHIVRDIARAIRAAHEVGIIHRDLKPENVMLVDRGRGEGETVKVLDFGISASSARSPGQERLTTAGQTLGTPEYMAPEQALGQEVTEAFDIYALGVIFYETLTGAPPFSGGNMVEIMARKTMEAAPPLDRARKDLPHGIAALVDDCLEIDPNIRPASARVFLARLDEILRAMPRSGGARASTTAGARPTPRSTPPPTPAELRRSNRRRAVNPSPWKVIAIGLGGGLMFGLAALGVWSFVRPAVRVSEPPSVAIPSDPDPKPAPVPAPMPAPMPAPTTGLAPAPAALTTPADVRPAPSKVPDAGSAPDPSASADTPACGQTRKRAEEAEASADWSGVLKHTEKRGCWQDGRARTRLRVQALKELGKFVECEKAGRGSSDATVAKWVAFCAKRANG